MDEISFIVNLAKTLKKRFNKSKYNFCNEIIKYSTNILDYIFAYWNLYNYDTF